MPIKLVVCDLDGTLIGDDLALSARLHRAVHRAREQDVSVTIATGRGFPSTRRFAHELGNTAPVVCYQGAQIRTMEGALLFESTLARGHLPPVIRFCQEGGWEIGVYCEDEIYQTTRMYDQAFYDRWFSLPVHLITDLMDALPHDPTKFIVTAPGREQGDQLERELCALAGGTYQVVRSHALFVEGLAPNVSKGAGVARLATRLGVRQEDVMAIGDSDNDSSMVAWAGIGVAMGNASPEVKRVASILAPTQDEDGAAWAIERYVLEAV